jgi:hypothetical protein
MIGGGDEDFRIEDEDDHFLIRVENGRGDGYSPILISGMQLS